MNKILRLTLLFALLIVGVGGINAATWSYEFTNQQFKTSGTAVTLNGISWTPNGAEYYGYETPSTGATSRGHQFGSKNKPAKEVTLSTSDFTGTISKVTVNAADYNGTAQFEVTVGGISYGTKTVSKKSTDYSFDGSSSGELIIKITNGARAAYIKTITVEYGNGGTTTTVTAPEISGETPFTDKTTVTITVPTGTTVYYTTDCSMPSDQGDDYQEPFEISATTTVKAVAYDSEGNHSSVVSKEFVKQANVTTTGSGTEADPYTCADVIALVNGNATPSDNVYVKGKVSTASTDTQANITQYGNATFYISDDGTATNQVQAFRNKNFNEEKYTSTSEIPQLGDDVVLCGKPTLYNGTIELASGNYLVSVIHNSVKVDTLSFTASEALAQLAAGTQPTGVCYISGTISQDVDTTGVAQYGNLTYYISDDGTETNQLEVFRGKSFNGEKFNSDFLLKKGDKVKILGRIINYTDTNTGTTTPEVTSGSVLVEYNGVTTGITNVKGDGTNVNAPAYNLAGQRVGKDYKGVVIQNGKKCIRK